ncbi:MAG TPA: IPT/TIG domain-containing protein [Bryobacteraceae bacterium]|jgi:hypothetical protein|nr:IPT/TIG domain-containing protein [Bryobacteraceae bacterium]
MRLSSLASLVLSAGCVANLPAFAFDGNHRSPEMNSISADTARPGDTLMISGVGLNSNNIDEVYLTDQKFDMQVKVLEQKDTYIKVRVPPFAKPGRMQILCLTKGANPTLLEQPLYVLIKDPSDNSKDGPATPAVVTVQMKPEDLPPPGTPISIPIVGAATPQVAAKKADPPMIPVKKTEAQKPVAVASKQ